MKKYIPAIFIVIVIIALIGSCSGGGRTKTNTCQSCGRTFEAGDSAGNYKNIARTNMCNNCYSNYMWAKEALGK